MTLPASSAISFSNINTELGLSSTAQISLNCTAVRNLFGQTSGTICMNTGHGKSATVIGCATYTSPGNYTFVVPSGVTSISALGVGGGAGGLGTYGAGGGAALNFVNNLSVSSGQSFTLYVGSGSYGTQYTYRGCSGGTPSNGGGTTLARSSTNYIVATGGYAQTQYAGYPALGGSASPGFGMCGQYSYSRNGYLGGRTALLTNANPGGGGAGGYQGIRQYLYCSYASVYYYDASHGVGGNGSPVYCCGTNLASGGWSSTYDVGWASQSAGGGGGNRGGCYYCSYGNSIVASAGGGGGGVGIFGAGSNGSAPSGASRSTGPIGAGGGSGGSSGSGSNGGTYGGGGGAGSRFTCGGQTTGGSGANGALRIMYPGNTRTF